MKTETDSIMSNGHTSAPNADNTNSSKKEGVLKKETGDETIPDISTNKPIMTREKIEDLPFEIIHQEEIGWWLGMGICRLNAPVQSKAELMYKMQGTNWELVINIIGAIMMMNELEKNKTYEKEQN